MGGGKDRDWGVLGHFGRDFGGLWGLRLGDLVVSLEWVLSSSLDELSQS